MPKDPRRERMVGWYDADQLLSTGMQVAASNAFGARADFRLFEALTTPQGIYDYSQKSALWLDYVADVGDGFNSTYAVASLLARDLTIGEHALPRGEVLVFGGDEVYPAASAERYQARLVTPYEDACVGDTPRADLFAIPGNHDWYDGLGAFMRLFARGHSIGSWRTRQARSYFALKLPHRWWFLGVDVQLESDLDRPQLDWFRGIAQQMERGDRVILASAEPNWIYQKIYADADDTTVDDERPTQRTNLELLEDEVLTPAGARIAVRVAGDLHHYRRHAADDGSQLITCGGGGAFLHATHRHSVRTLKEKDASGAPTTFHLKREFPHRATSRALSFGNLFFFLKNPRFGALTAVAYALLAWLMFEPAGGELPKSSERYTLLLLRPGIAAWVIAIVVGFVLFTDTHKRWFRLVAGALHGLLHVAAAFGAGVFGHFLVASLVEETNQVTRLLLILMATMGFGYVLGAGLMGVYLFVSLEGFGRHMNEAFSALRIEDWKSFLRIHIDAKGELTIYPVGIQRVPRLWDEVRDPKPGTARYTPTTPIIPHLIEGAVEVLRRRDH